MTRFSARRNVESVESRRFDDRRSRSRGRPDGYPCPSGIQSALGALDGGGARTVGRWPSCASVDIRDGGSLNGRINQNWVWSSSRSAALAPGAAAGAALAPRPSHLRDRQGRAPRHAPCSDRKHAQPRDRRFLDQKGVGERPRGGRDGCLRRRRGLRARGAPRLSPRLRVSLCAPDRTLDSADREQAGQGASTPQEGRRSLKRLIVTRD